MQTVREAVRQLSRLDDDPLDRMADAQGNALQAAEERLMLVLETGGVETEDARRIAACALVRFIEGSSAADLFRLVNPFDPLLRPAVARP
jgi:hypothetical protein